MLNSPVRVISKTITVCSTDEPSRFAVVVYRDGKVDASHPPMPREEADQLADAIADGDEHRNRRQIGFVQSPTS